MIATMHLTVSIDILEVHKSLHAHFIVKSIHSFLNDVKLPNFLLRIEKNTFLSIFGDFYGKTEGGAEKGEILVNFRRRKKVQKKSPK